MKQQKNNTSGRLLGIFFLGGLLFNYPLLSLVNKKVSLFGLPLLYLYLFMVWGLLLFLVYWAIRKDRDTIPGSLSGEDGDADN